MDSSPTFLALQTEALFTNQLLGSGINQIRKANYGNKGMYFQAFNSLSIGLERIGKLCLILDFYLKNNNKFPEKQHLKKYGHKLVEINKKIDSFIIEYNLKSSLYLNEIQTPIEKNILNILDDFAMGDRYSNIDHLTNTTQKNDPISNWCINIDDNLFKIYISKDKQEKLATLAYIYSEIYFNSVVLFSSEDGKSINTFKDMSLGMGNFQAISEYRKLYVLKIIRRWVLILIELSNQCRQFNNTDFPFFKKIFILYINNDKFLKGKKDYLKL
ncbi:MAG: hypothetical protein RL344_436 [Pseudomonadota bacterium]